MFVKGWNIFNEKVVLQRINTVSDTAYLWDINMSSDDECNENRIDIAKFYDIVTVLAVVCNLFIHGPQGQS